MIWETSSNVFPGMIISMITLDATGVYMAGYEDISGGNVDFEWRIEKRDLNTGVLIWSQTSNPSAAALDQALAITVDGTGVYIAGYDRVPGPGDDEWRIEKRNLTTGAVIWTQTNNPTTLPDIAKAITLDGTGVYVAGYYNSWPGRIEKRDLATGALVAAFGTTGVVNTSVNSPQSITQDATGIYFSGTGPASKEKRCK